MKRDWRKYNKSLIQRFTFYISRDTYNKWQEELAIKNKGKKGRPFAYADCFIQWLFMIKCMFRMPYRQLEGFARIIGEFLKILPC